MKHRLRWALVPLLFASLLVVSLLDHPVGQAQQTLEQSDDKVASLKDQLEKGLRARRTIEFQFIARVVQLVDSGQLSKDVVQTTFSWTIKKYRVRKYMVPYFEQVLRQRLAKDKITVLDNVPTTLTKTTDAGT